MTTLSTISPTLLDLAKRLDPDGKIATIVELLAQTNEVLADMPWVEANDKTGHTTTIRSGLPSATWRKMYQGVQPSKSRTVQVTDSMGMLETYAEVDKALADLNGNTASFRMSEDMAFIEGMNQEFAQTLFYGDESSAPEEFTGFSPRFNSQSAENGANILTSAATPDSTDNTSIWLVGWGPNTVHGIYPKGSMAGLKVSDLGEVTAGDRTNGYFQAYRTHYKWDCGLTVRDWRYVVRINFDLEDIVASASSGPNLIELMGKAMRRLPSLTGCKPVFYMNRDALDALDLQCNARTTQALQTMEDAQGQLVTMFRKVPVRRCDAILSTESGI